jgi:hypothetical protein
MRMFCLIVGCVCPILASTAAVAQLAEKRFIKKTEEALGSYFSRTNEACGSSITASIDWESFKNTTELVPWVTWDQMVNPTNHRHRNVQMELFCGREVGSALSSICRDDDDGKEAVQAIKTFTCHYGKEEKLVLTEGAQGEGKAMDFWTDLTTDKNWNNSSYVKRELMGKL